MLSAIEPANRCGRCGIQATRATPGVRIQVGSSRSPTRTDPPSGATNPSNTRSSVDLPQPLGPVTATISPGSTAATPRRARSRPLGVAAPSPRRTAISLVAGSGTSARPARRRRRLQHLEHLLGGADPLGAGVVVGAERAQRQVGLGHQHQHEQRRAQVQVARRAGAARPQPRPAPPRSSTAVRGSARTGTSPAAPPSSPGDGDRRSRRSRGLALGGAEHLQRRQPADDVEEVAGEPLQDPQLRCRPVPCGRAHQRHEHRDQRQREDDDRGRDPIAGAARPAPPAARSRPAGPGGDTARSSRPARRSRGRQRGDRAGALRADPRPARAPPRVAAARPQLRLGQRRARPAASSAPQATAARAGTTTSSAAIGPQL